jgi:hypothetical protein
LSCSILGISISDSSGDGGGSDGSDGSGVGSDVGSSGVGSVGSGNSSSSDSGCESTMRIFLSIPFDDLTLSAYILVT